ncbi:MAG TPA: hypothetical protein IGS52_09810 [Oscillatoriaceae cyanobacterium M33_DOE_052]|nr:hypothetical protein [Oscillatoriaceae cyanobacterium M33_DOE_052]
MAKIRAKNPPEMRKKFFHCYEYGDRTESGLGLGTDHYGLGNVFWAVAVRLTVG